MNVETTKPETDQTAADYRGMTQIIRFNWPWYVGAGIVVAATAFLLPRLPLATPLKFGIALALFPACFWSIASLAASHWIYDRSPVRDCKWLSRFPNLAPARAANVHAGFDETTPCLRARFAQTHFDVWDIFNAAIATEDSIRRARALKGCGADSVAVDAAHLPAAARDLDAVFAIFAAHELRSADSRANLFREIARILKPGCPLIVVEHLRDWKNFAAYGPGFMHFLPYDAWMQAAAAAGLKLSTEFNITPFVHVFRFTKDPHEN